MKYSAYMLLFIYFFIFYAKVMKVIDPTQEHPLFFFFLIFVNEHYWGTLQMNKKHFSFNYLKRKKNIWLVLNWFYF